MKLHLRPICQYCNEPAILVDSAEVHKRSYGLVWLCRPCNAWVGVHKDSENHQPLGSLANKELRKWRRRAHAAFDPIWHYWMQKNGGRKTKARRQSYSWLAKALDLTEDECHIAMFDIAQCQAVIAACEDWEVRLTA